MIIKLYEDNCIFNTLRVPDYVGALEEADRIAAAVWSGYSPITHAVVLDGRSVVDRFDFRRDSMRPGLRRAS